MHLRGLEGAISLTWHGLLNVEAVSFNELCHAPYPCEQHEVDVHGDDLFQPGLKHKGKWKMNGPLVVALS